MYLDGVCGSDGDKFCADSNNCFQFGLCHFDGHGGCFAKNPADCKASLGCLLSSNCKHDNNGRCVRTTPAIDCSKTAGCHALGTCTRRNSK